MLHFFEEPPISGTHGSGAVFFSGCTLRCEFCQNKKISRAGAEGTILSPKELADLFLDLQGRGAQNINLVTPTHFSDRIRDALLLAKPKLSIPVVYNTSGYERVETLKMLEGLIDVYLPDYKYVSPTLSERYSHAPDYGVVAEQAITEMFRQTGAYALDENGRMIRGVMVRHLVLPGGRKDSFAVLDRLSQLFPTDQILLSLMSQYTPEFATESPHTELHRRITSFEYQSVLDHALSLGFEGYMQDRSAATTQYTPNF